MNTISSLLKNLRNRTPVGSVQMYAGSSAPTDWLICDGSAVSRETFSALFDRIGTTYGNGDGTTTFNLPDFRDKFPVGAGTSYALNAAGGSKDAIIPYHHHGFTNPSVGAAGAATIGGGGHEHTYTAIQYVGGNHQGQNGSYYGHQSLTSWTGGGGGHTHSIGDHTHSISGGSVHYEGVSATNANLPPYRGINFIIYAGTTAA